MSGDGRQVWRVSRLRFFPGRYFNSPKLERWCECGTVPAHDEDEAGARAMEITGGRGAVRVEAVGEFYRPETLL